MIFGPDIPAMLAIEHSGLGRPIKQRIVKLRHGWACRTTHGTAKIDGVYAWTERGIRRKANKLRRQLQLQDERDQHATVVEYPA